MSEVMMDSMTLLMIGRRQIRLFLHLFGPGNGSLTLTHLVVLVVVVVVVVLGLTLFEKSLRLLHFLFKFLQISSHNPL